MASTSIRPSNEDDDGGAANEVYAGLDKLSQIPTEPAIRRIYGHEDTFHALLLAGPSSLPKLERDSHQVAPYYKATTCDDSGYGDSSCSFSITTASIDNGQSDTVSVNQLNQLNQMGHASNNNPGLRARTSHKSCPQCKPERCGECNEEFSSQESLLEHFRTVHKTEYPDIVHRCLHCKDGFRNHSFLDHLLRRHGYRISPADPLDRRVVPGGASSACEYLLPEIGYGMMDQLELELSSRLRAPVLYERICNDICSRLERCAISTRHYLLEDRLWWLLEDFSDKLGLEAIDIQHKNRSAVAKHWEDVLRDAYLRAALHSTSEFGEEAISQLAVRIEQHIWNATEENSLCVSDQMRLWRRMVAASKDESAGGMTDQNSASQTPVKTSLAPEYQRLLDTRAYEWLLATITRQASLNWEISNPVNVMDKVRLTVPVTSLEYRESRQDATTTFRLPWEPIQTRFDQERMKANARCPLLKNLAAITCTSDNQLQVTTVGQYFWQTWADDGSGLLESLQKWFEHRDESISAPTEMSSPQIQFSQRGSNLFVNINGPSYFLVQCGEQLAWLGSALQTPASDLRIYAPRITAMGEVDFLISTKPATLAEAARALSLLEKPLQLLHKQSICSGPVVGFPTANRPVGTPGLEIPWNILLMIAEKPKIEPASGSSNSHRLLLGLQTTLNLVQIIDGVSLWHIVNHPLTACTCSHNFLDPKQRETIQSIKFEELAGFRQIVNSCDRVKAPATQGFGTPSSPEVTWHLEASGRRTPDHSLAYLETHSPADTSIDSDIFSVSSFSQETHAEHSNDDDKWSPVVLAVVPRLLAGICNSIQINCTAADGDNTNNDAGFSGSSSPKGTPATSLETSTCLGVSQKRSVSHRDSEDPDDDPDEGFQQPPHKISKRVQEKTQIFFACPFLKFDPVKYKTCFSFKLKQVSRVKQHLIRNHVPQFFCPRCLAIFKIREAYNRHLMQPSGYFCTPNPSGRLDGISPQQQLQLSKKSRHPASSEKDKWFAIWAILFPGYPPPRSPYVDTQLTEDLARFQEHCLRAGPDLVAQEVVASGVLSVTELTDETRGDILRRAIAAGLNIMINDWSRSRLCPLNHNSGRVSFSEAKEETNPLDIVLTVTPADSAPENRELIFSGFLEQLSPPNLSYRLEDLSGLEYQTSASHEVESVRRDSSTVVHNASTQSDQPPPIHSMSYAPGCASDMPGWGQILNAADLGFLESFDAV